MTSNERRWRVPEGAAGDRLDRHAAAELDESRNRVQRWISEGRLTLDARTVRPSHPLQGGEVLHLTRPQPVDSRVRPEAGDLALLFEDEHLVVLDKPAGQIVHPGAGHASGTLANLLLDRYPEMAGVGGEGRPGIVHRLDRDTSGVMVVAKTQAAYRGLTDDFAGRRVDKHYLAVVYGDPGPKGEISAPIRRHRTRRKEMAVGPGGRPARTLYRTLSTAEGVSLLKIRLETGRTHQIRVHFKYAGHPLVGDPVYGENRWRGLSRPRRRHLATFPRPALHARTLAFSHPVTDARQVYTAPLPDDFIKLWEGWTGGPMPDDAAS
ncbi:MAG: RluA family pseudouridine synthase [Acidobacteriota bacterium]